MQPEQLPMPASSASAAPIYLIRGERMVLDEDLARLFGVETRRLTQQLRRNLDRFEGYAVHLEPGEYENLKSRNAASSSGHGGRRKPPWAFTEHGVVMAATILNSGAAISAMRMIVEVFVAHRRAGALAPVPGPAIGLVPRLQQALEGLLDSVVDTRSQTTVREEAQALLAQSIQHLKDRLGRQGIENEEIAARAVKLLADAEVSKAAAAKTQAEASEIELRLLVRKLRLVIEAERAIAVADLGGFLAVLEDLGRP